MTYSKRRVCHCPESRVKNASKRDWYATGEKDNQGRSEVKCEACLRQWFTRAAYLEELT